MPCARTWKDEEPLDGVWRPGIPHLPDLATVGPGMRIFEGLAKEFELDPEVVNREPLKVSKRN